MKKLLFILIAVALANTIALVYIATSLYAPLPSEKKQFGKARSGLQHWKSRQVLSSVAFIKAYDASKDKWYPFGTGVFLDIDSTYPHVFLITNRHIFVARDTFHVSVNIYDDHDSTLVYKSKLLPISKQNNAFVPASADSDFVAIFVNRPNIEGFNPINLQEIESTVSLEYGQDVEFYGFPLYDRLGLHNANYQFPILRMGAISYFVSDTSTKPLLPSMFLIDGASYGGGSGSPVFSKRLIIEHFRKLSYERKLIGIISGHLSIKGAVNIQPKNIANNIVKTDSIDIEEFIESYRFSYTQNSDLAVVVSMDIIVTYIRRQYKTYLLNVKEKELQALLKSLK